MALSLEPPFGGWKLPSMLGVAAKAEGARASRLAVSTPAVGGDGMIPVGKPDAGKPHVRFAERGRETERWSGLRHQCIRESDWQRLLPTPVSNRA